MNTPILFGNHRRILMCGNWVETDNPITVRTQTDEEKESAWRKLIAAQIKKGGLKNWIPCPMVKS